MVTRTTAAWTDECCTGHHDQCDYWPDCGCPCHQEEQ